MWLSARTSTAHAGDELGDSYYHADTISGADGRQVVGAEGRGLPKAQPAAIPRAAKAFLHPLWRLTDLLRWSADVLAGEGEETAPLMIKRSATSSTHMS